MSYDPNRLIRAHFRAVFVSAIICMGVSAMIENKIVRMLFISVWAFVALLSLVWVMLRVRRSQNAINRLAGIVIVELDQSQHLSQDEVDTINKLRGVCLDCRKGLLLAGPAGGIAQNFRCGECGATLNLFLATRATGMATENVVLGGHRIDSESSTAIFDKGLLASIFSGMN